MGHLLFPILTVKDGFIFKEKMAKKKEISKNEGIFWTIALIVSGATATTWFIISMV